MLVSLSNPMSVHDIGATEPLIMLRSFCQQFFIFDITNALVIILPIWQ